MESEQRAAGLAYFIVGAALGAALGLLLAPSPGEETREKLGDWLRARRLFGPELSARLRRVFSPRGEALIVDGRTSSRKHRRGR